MICPLGLLEEPSIHVSDQNVSKQPCRSGPNPADLASSFECWKIAAEQTSLRHSAALICAPPPITSCLYWWPGYFNQQSVCSAKAAAIKGPPFVDSSLYPQGAGICQSEVSPRQACYCPASSDQALCWEAAQVPLGSGLLWHQPHWKPLTGLPQGGQTSQGLMF